MFRKVKNPRLLNLLFGLPGRVVLVSVLINIFGIGMLK